MSNIDWSMLLKAADIAAAEQAATLAALGLVETSWVRTELLIIADQLLALEDDDPNRMPGTDREWRDYRIKVRAWKEGTEGYPEIDSRPQRPTGE